MHIVVNDLHEEYAAEVNTIYHDQEINNPHHDNHSDAFVIGSNASTDSCCLEDEIVFFERLKNVEKINKTTSDNLRSAVDVEDSLPFPDLQKKTECSRKLQEGQQKDLDQQSIGYVSPADFEQPSPADLEQFTHTIEIKEDNQPHYFHLQSEQKLKEVFHYYLIDPIADFLEPTNNVNVKIFFIEQSWSDHLFEPFFYMIWLHLLFESRSRMPVNHNLTWLHWKSSVT